MKSHAVTIASNDRWAHVCRPKSFCCFSHFAFWNWRRKRKTTEATNPRDKENKQNHLIWSRSKNASAKPSLVVQFTHFMLAKIIKFKVECWSNANSQQVYVVASCAHSKLIYYPTMNSILCNSNWPQMKKTMKRKRSSAYYHNKCEADIKFTWFRLLTQINISVKTMNFILAHCNREKLRLPFNFISNRSVSTNRKQIKWNVSYQ